MKFVILLLLTELDGFGTEAFHVLRRNTPLHLTNNKELRIQSASRFTHKVTRNCNLLSVLSRRNADIATKEQPSDPADSQAELTSPAVLLSTASDEINEHGAIGSSYSNDEEDIRRSEKRRPRTPVSYRVQQSSKLLHFITNDEQLDTNHEQIDANHEQLSTNHEQIDANSEQLNTNYEQIDANSEQPDTNHEQLDSSLSCNREKATEIALSYKPTEFEPPVWATNCHFQTIGGALLRSLDDDGYDFSYWPPTKKSATLGDKRVTPSTFWDKRERIETNCDDFFDVDYKYCVTSTMADGSDPGLVVIAHGLESSSYSPQIIDAAKAYLSIGMDVACVNFRGCSGEPNVKPGAYHLGFTDDLKFFLSKLKQEEKGPRRVYMSGFSLGANVVLKLLGELGDSALEKYSIYGAATGSSPFDLMKSAPKFGGTLFNRKVYDANFLKSLKNKAQQQTELLGTIGVPFDIEKCISAQTIPEFENAYLVPTYGFEDHWDYYRKSSCIHFLDNITVPTIVVNSLDDPFFDPSCYPAENESMPIKYHYTNAGGHLGFLFQKRESECNESPVAFESSWFSSELARFVDHVHNFDKKL